jgi:hypothetical protein
VEVTRPLEHKLVAPTAEDGARARAILEGRYELPRVPDLVRAKRILDVGAGVGAFAAWCHYVWPHAWADCYEPNESRAGYCKQNAPPGTLVHASRLESPAELGPFDVVRLADGNAIAFLESFGWLNEIGVLVLEWHSEYELSRCRRIIRDLGLDLRLAASRVDNLGAGCEVWLRSTSVYEPAIDEHIVVAGDSFTIGDGATTFALGVPHTPWVAERVESLRRLQRELDGSVCGVIEAALKFEDREPNHVWSAKMWRWAFESTATHLVSLQDDARIAPNFWRALSGMVDANPHEIIGLQAPHPSIPFLAAQGQRWCHTRAWVVGVGYVIPKPVLRELLAWRNRQPAWRIVGTNEDTLINDFCLETRRRVFHPIPTIVDHDTTLASTYDNDRDTHRHSLVRWVDGSKYGFGLEELERVSFWSTGASTEVPMPKEERNVE